MSTHVNAARMNNFRMFRDSTSAGISGTSLSRIVEEYPGFHHNAAHHFLLNSSLFSLVDATVPEYCNNSHPVTQNASGFMMTTVKNAKPYLTYTLSLLIHHNLPCHSYTCCMISLRKYPNNFFNSFKVVTIIYSI